MEVELNKILATTMKSHMLYLYSSGINRYDIHSTFLSLVEGRKIAYVSNDDPQKIKSMFPGVSIVKPEKLPGIKASMIIFDGESVNGGLKYESVLSKLKIPVLCTYPVSSVNQSNLKDLVSHHSNMVLVTESATVLSSKNLGNIDIVEESIEKWIKKNLETIVLALLLKKPMSGKDIIKTIHINFNTLVSPGRIYPLLHDLNQKGLLTFEYKIRDKIYKPKGPESVEKIINNELKTSQFVLNKFSALEL